MQELLTYITKELVTDPDAVEITEAERRGENVFRISVAEPDRGLLIGRQGRTIKAIETVIQAASRGRAPGLEVAD